MSKEKRDPVHQKNSPPTSAPTNSSKPLEDQMSPTTMTSPSWTDLKATTRGRHSAETQAVFPVLNPVPVSPDDLLPSSDDLPAVPPSEESEPSGEQLPPPPTSSQQPLPYRRKRSNSELVLQTESDEEDNHFNSLPRSHKTKKNFSFGLGEQALKATLPSWPGRKKDSSPQFAACSTSSPPMPITLRKPPKAGSKEAETETLLQKILDDFKEHHDQYLLAKTLEIQLPRLEDFLKREQLSGSLVLKINELFDDLYYCASYFALRNSNEAASVIFRLCLQARPDNTAVLQHLRKLNEPKTF